MTHTKYQKYIFGHKSSHLKIGANGAGAYTIPQSVSQTSIVRQALKTTPDSLHTIPGGS